MKTIVYSLPTSTDCQRARQFFSENGIQFEVRNVEEQKFKNELVTGYHSLTLPTIVMDNEIVLGFGINKNRIMKRLNLRGNCVV